MGQFRQGVTGDDRGAWEEEQSRTEALKQLQFVSVSWGLWKKEAPWQTLGSHHRGQSSSSGGRQGQEGSRG